MTMTKTLRMKILFQSLLISITRLLISQRQQETRIFKKYSKLIRLKLKIGIHPKSKSIGLVNLCSIQVGSKIRVELLGQQRSAAVRKARASIRTRNQKRNLNQKNRRKNKAPILDLAKNQNLNRNLKRRRSFRILLRSCQLLVMMLKNNSRRKTRTHQRKILIFL